MNRYIIIFLLMLASSGAFAQQECAYELEEAQDMFDAGLIENIPEKLSSCLRNGFTNEEKLQAYKLIILSHIFADNLEDADAMMLEFLKDFPSYEPVATDPREFIALLETYDTDPVLRIGLHAGFNSSSCIVSDRFGTHNFVENRGEYIPGGVGFQVGFHVEKNLGQRFVLGGEFQLENNLYGYVLETENEQFTAEITDFCRVEYYETQSRISLPLSLQYKFIKKGNITPYVIAGMKPAMLFSNNAVSERIYNTGTGYDKVVTEIRGSDLLTTKRIFNAWAFAGGGISTDLGTFQLFLEARLHYNLLGQVRSGDNRFVEELVWQTFYVDDDFIMNQLSISAGLTFPIYHPKKKGE